MIDLDELFSRDPFKLSREDKTAIIAELTAQKHNFDKLAEEGKKPSRAKKKGPKGDSSQLEALLGTELL